MSEKSYYATLSLTANALSIPYSIQNSPANPTVLERMKEYLKEDLIPFVIEDQYRTKYIEGLKEYRNTEKTELLQKLFAKEQNKFANKVAYFLGKEYH